MKNILILVATLLLPAAGMAQNIVQLGHVDYQALHGADLANLWGYVDENGNEYAIVGTTEGTSIVDVTNPALPVEKFFAPGPNSMWREVKVWGDYAYITTEASDGLTIIDMSPLPGSSALTVTNFYGPSGDTWITSHSLFIDENGILFIHGSDRGNGGVIMYDLNTSPTNPTEIGEYDNWYVHDSYARGDTLYAAHITDGFFTIVDVSNPASPVMLSGQEYTPMSFAHNCWLSDDGDYLFTTDEKSGAWIGAYDVSDPTDVKEVDRIRRSETSGVIPHNTYWLNNYLVTSYYRDGVTIHDVTDPSNMIEVGNFDTSPFSGDGFNGAWGVYPYLPSGNLLISDMEEGLFILGPTYVRACYLSGIVTDASTTNAISNAYVEIVSTPNFDNSSLSGNYSTGTGSPGTYTVIASKAGYITDTIFNVSMTAANTTTLNIPLTPLPSFTLTGQVINSVTTNGIAGAQISISNTEYSYTATTDASGNYTISPFYDSPDDNFEVVVGAWGYQTECASNVEINSTTGGSGINFTLDPGYYDDFSFDFGWTTGGTSTVGLWVREEPNGTTSSGDQSNPEFDVTGDCIDKAYVTGNATGGGAGNDDVDNGDVTLNSPIFDVTGITDPHINLSLWFFNGGGFGSPNDTVVVMLNTGSSDITLGRFDVNNFTLSAWNQLSYQLSDYTTATTNLQLRFYAIDEAPGHLVEAGVDHFYISAGTAGQNEITDNSNLLVFPNPFNSGFTINTGTDNGMKNIEIFDMSGRKVYQNQTNGNTIYVEFNSGNGIYILQVTGADGSLKRQKIVKQ